MIDGLNRFFMYTYVMSNSQNSGFILSDAAMYAFQCQDVYPDVLSFAVAIPDHLKQLFLIPVQVELSYEEPSDKICNIASNILSAPTGESDASDLFSYKSFVNYDDSPSITQGEERSIHYNLRTPSDLPASQPGDQFCGSYPRYDYTDYSPDETSFMTDGDSTDLMINEGYPYRTNEKVRHSFIKPCKLKIAIKPEILQSHAPPDIMNRAIPCSVSFISYYKPNRMYTFSVDCGNKPHSVQAVLSEIDEVTMSCDCPFWRWGGPEFHAKTKKFLIGRARGTASPPDIRDPDRKYWLCKHSYAVLRKLENHVQRIVDEHWELDDDDLLNTIDSEWDKLSKDVQVPIEEIEETTDGALKIGDHLQLKKRD